jgi:tetratricopeptide (TPR) repeat protein
MSNIVKWALIALAVVAAGYAALRVMANTQKETCLNGEGRPAMEACSFVVKWGGGDTKTEALFKRSRLYARQQLHERERADLEAILPAVNSAGLTPARRAEIYAALSAAYGRGGDQEKALKYSELAVQTGGSGPAVYLALAGAYIDLGRHAEAVALLEKAEGLEKNHTYYNALAAAYSGKGDYRAAYAALKAALKVKAPRPVLAATAKQMGMVCFELKLYKEADLYLGYAQRSGADCPECPLLLTAIRESLGAYQ